MKQFLGANSKKETSCVSFFIGKIMLLDLETSFDLISL